jgi:hypothetical protein
MHGYYNVNENVAAVGGVVRSNGWRPVHGAATKLSKISVSARPLI